MDFKEAIGAIVAGVVLLIPAVKWLLSDWAKKAEEIEALKKKNTDQALVRLEADAGMFKAHIANLQDQIKQHSEKLITSNAKIIALEEKLSESKRIIEKHGTSLAGDIRQVVRSEIIDLTKNASLIRNKKNG
jgi:septal ring factor EnvC (AmiA/AmiB activator)